MGLFHQLTRAIGETRVKENNYWVYLMSVFYKETTFSQFEIIKMILTEI